MSYVNLEGGDRLSSYVVQNSMGIQQMPTVMVMNLDLTDRGGDNTEQIQPASSSYVLSPSPTFDPVFDNFLEGRMSNCNGNSSSNDAQMSVKSENLPNDDSTRKLEYLNELLGDEKKLQEMPNFIHLQPLVKREIERVRDQLRIRATDAGSWDSYRERFNLQPSDQMPAADGPVLTVIDRVDIPIDQYPNYNFIGRLVGPRGRTIRQLEQATGCLLTIRGRGSDKDWKRARSNVLRDGEELHEALHVRILATDHKERATFKVSRAKRAVEDLLVPVDDDELKQKQLRELAHIRFQTRRMNAGTMQPQSVPMLMEENPFVQSYQNLPQQFVSASPPPTNVYYLDPNMAEIDANAAFLSLVWPQQNTY